MHTASCVHVELHVVVAFLYIHLKLHIAWRIVGDKIITRYVAYSSLLQSLYEVFQLLISGKFQLFHYIVFVVIIPNRFAIITTDGIYPLLKCDFVWICHDAGVYNVGR